MELVLLAQQASRDLSIDSDRYVLSISETAYWTLNLMILGLAVVWVVWIWRRWNDTDTSETPIAGFVMRLLWTVSVPLILYLIFQDTLIVQPVD